MKITLVMPSIGRRPEAPDDYVGSWQMEPLALAVLGGLTPSGHELSIADDRMEKIPYDEPTDLVAINVETFTARRAWQIADEFRKRGVKVVVGGFHATLVPEEAAEHADAVMVGSAFSRATESPGRGYHWGMATADPLLPRGSRITVNELGSLEQIIKGPATGRNDGSLNLLGAIMTSMGVLGCKTIKDLHSVEMVIMPSFGTEGKSFQIQQRVGMAT